MKFGFIKVMAASPKLKVGDTAYNLESARECFDEAERVGANLLVFPELHLTAYTCGDLFYSDTLLDGALEALEALRDYTSGKRCMAVIGVPVRTGGKLYNCAAVIQNGAVLGVVPKTVLPNYGEFYEKRQFSSGADYRGENTIRLAGCDVPFGRDLLFCCREMPDFVLGVEICEDLWAPVTPSTGLCLAGATVIANLSASNELIGKNDYRRLLVSSASSRLICGYVYANAGHGESTQDMVFSGHSLIYENGQLLAEKKPFAKNGLIATEIDLFRLRFERHRNTSFDESSAPECRRVYFSQELRDTELTRHIARRPFVPADGEILAERAEAILSIQSDGLMRRIEHTGCCKAVIGISGGLDSTLALLVMVRAMDMLGRPREDIVAVTMPCFGTTERTRSNAEKLCEELDVSFMTVDIGAAVRQHFADIGHDEGCTDVTYENCQARERTQVLMDIANKVNGLDVGTEDLSEFVDGWCTYNGDHTSMYDVNMGLTKTQVRAGVRYIAQHTEDKVLADALWDVLDCPVTPELLPIHDDQIEQKSEENVGSYSLQDFFTHKMMICGFSPAKTMRLAKAAYGDEFTDEELTKWLRSYCKRYFSQQFKRSCLMDGPSVEAFSVSPRTGFLIPSDAENSLFMASLDTVAKE